MSDSKPATTIERSLARLKQRVRRVQWWRALVQTGAVCLAGLLALVAVEMLLGPLGSGARWLMWGVWWSGTGAMFWRSTTALRRPITEVALARWVELRHPEFDERLSTALEVQGDQGVSAALLQEIVGAAEKDVEGLNPDHEIRWVEWLKRWLWPVAGLAAVLLGWVLSSPMEMGRVVWRVVAPFSQIGSVGADELAVRPGSVELMEGDAIEITARAKRAEPLRVALELEGGERIEQSMSEADGEWRYRLEPVQKSFRYAVKMGRQTSDRMEVKVWPMPRWTGGSIRIVSPAYTGLPPREVGAEGRITAVVGSRLEMEGVMPLGVEAIRGVWTSRGEGEGTIEGEREVSASGVRVKLAAPLDRAGEGEWVVTVGHRLGRELEVLRLPLEVVGDRAPEVVRVRPSGESMRVRPEEALELVYGVTEDHGVAEVRLEAEAGERKWEMPVDLPEEVVKEPVKKYRGVIGLSVGEARDALEGADSFRVRVMAFDARPEALDGPGRGVSSWLNIDLDERAESLAWQRLKEEHEGAKRALETSAREAREAKDRMEWHRGEMRNESLSEQAVKHFEEAAERLAKAQERMERMAAAMEESVHAKEAAKAKQWAEQLKLAKQELESIPLQDDAGKRESKLEFARQTAEEAARQMEQMRERLERERQKVEDLAKLEELATKQRELARQAEQALRNGEKVEDKWKNEQKRVEEALRQRLRDQPQAMATSLEMQAEEAKRLAEEAKELAEAQQALQEAASNAGNPEKGDEPEGAEDPEEKARKMEEGVKAALQQEQASIAEALKEAWVEAQEARAEEADRLPEAAAAANQAKEALAQGKPEEARQGAEKAAEALAEMGKEAGGEEAGKENAGEKAKGEAESAGAEGKEAGAEGSAEGQEKGAEAPGEEAAAGHGTEPEGEKGAAEPEGAGNKKEGGEPELGKEGSKESGSSSPAGAEERARAEQLAELRERQEKVAEALGALERGDVAEALQAAAEMQADGATRLSMGTRAITEVDGHGALDEARGQSREAGVRAEEAKKQGERGRSEAAAENHGRSSEHLEQAAAALARTAEDFRQRAEELKGREASAARAPAGAEELAKAFQEAGAAAESAEQSAASKGNEPRVPVEGRQAAQAKEAAAALAAAAQSARSQMQGRGPSPSDPGQNPPMPGEGEGLDEPQEGPRPAQAEPGVPPELAKLGISAEDWEKIRESLQSDVGGRSGVGVPEEYMGLVKEYFQSMSQGGGNE